MVRAGEAGFTDEPSTSDAADVVHPSLPVAPGRGSLPAEARPWARGLTPDGLARFDQLSRGVTTDYERRLYNELERLALARGRAGDPVHSWERVEEARESLDAARRKEIEDEIRQKVRADALDEERQRVGQEQASLAEQRRRAREARRRRGHRRWAGWTVGTTAGTAAVLAGVDVPLWQKAVLVALTLTGCVVTGADRGSDDAGPE